MNPLIAQAIEQAGVDIAIGLLGCGLCIALGLIVAALFRK